MKLLLTLAMFAVLLVIGAQKANAQQLVGLKNYRTTGKTSTVQLTEEEAKTLWASNVPVCVKNGSKLLGTNQAFEKLGLGYSDCSNGADTKLVHEKRGFKVIVIKAASLPASMLK